MEAVTWPWGRNTDTRACQEVPTHPRDSPAVPADENYRSRCRWAVVAVLDWGGSVGSVGSGETAGSVGGGEGAAPCPRRCRRRTAAPRAGCRRWRTGAPPGWTASSSRTHKGTGTSCTCGREGVSDTCATHVKLWKTWHSNGNIMQKYQNMQNDIENDRQNGIKYTAKCHKTQSK